MFFFTLPAETSGISGTYSISFERSWKHLSKNVLHALEIVKLWSQNKKRKTNTQLLGDYKSRWSNDRNRSNDSGSFSHRFLLVFGLHIDLLIYASVVKKMVLSTPRCLRILSNLQTYYQNVPLYRREHFLKPLPSSTESIRWKKNVSETEICQSKQV